MVCHETYKDQKGNWLYPEEIEKIDKNVVIKKKDKSPVLVGPQESMSKSKKNTIDPEVMIKKYGADSVRWFILSDSPPEKDVQWSDTGVVSAHKFLQKLWNLNYTISVRKESMNEKIVEDKFKQSINNYISKIDSSISDFRFNVAIALFYEMYNYLKNIIDKKISNLVLVENMIKIMKIMIPFAPHLSYECLELLKCKSTDNWPTIDRKDIFEEVKIAVQVNGKTRDVISVKKDLIQTELEKIIFKELKGKKIC